MLARMAFDDGLDDGTDDAAPVLSRASASRRPSLAPSLRGQPWRHATRRAQGHSWADRAVRRLGRRARGHRRHRGNGWAAARRHRHPSDCRARPPPTGLSTQPPDRPRGRPDRRAVRVRRSRRCASRPATGTVERLGRDVPQPTATSSPTGTSSTARRRSRSCWPSGKELPGASSAPTATPTSRSSRSTVGPTRWPTLGDGRRRSRSVSRRSRLGSPLGLPAGRRSPSASSARSTGRSTTRDGVAAARHDPDRRADLARLVGRRAARRHGHA